MNPDIEHPRQDQSFPRAAALTLEDHRLLLLSSRSFTNQAVVALVLYFLLWLPGLIANIIWLRECKQIEKQTGQRLSGHTALILILWVFAIAPPLLLMALVLLLMALTLLNGGILGAIGWQECILFLVPSIPFAIVASLLLRWQFGRTSAVPEDSTNVDADPYQTATRSWPGYAVLAILVIALTGIAIKAIWVERPDSSSATSNQPSSTPLKLSDRWTVTVDRAIQTDAFAEGRALSETATGKYVIIEISVVNRLSTSAVGFPSYSFQLVDSQGRTHFIDSSANSSYVVSYGIYDLQPEWQSPWYPGTVYPEALVFDVPEDSSEFTLVAEDGSTSISIVPTLYTTPRVTLSGTFTIYEWSKGSKRGSCKGDVGTDSDLTGVLAGLPVTVVGSNSEVLGTGELSEGQQVQSSTYGRTGCRFNYSIDFPATGTGYISVTVDGFKGVSFDQAKLKTKGWVVSLEVPPSDL